MSTAPSSAFALRAALVAETLFYGFLGGMLFFWFDVPAGLISGAAVAVSIAALAGRPSPMPISLQHVIFIMLGMALGSAVTPEQIRAIATYPLSIALLVITIVCTAAASALYLHLVHRWDRLSAMLGSYPGALSQVIATAADMKANLQAVAIAQSFRIVVISVGIGPVLALMGLMQRTPGAPAAHHADASSLLLIIPASIGLGAFFHTLRLPGGLMLGAMIASASLQGFGIVSGTLPSWTTNAAMVAIGAMIGSRFRNVSPRMLASHLAAAAGSLAVGLAVAMVFVTVAAMWLGSPLLGTIFAYAPGATDAVMALTLALSLDAVYVSTHHIARFIFLALALPFVARALAGPTQRASRKKPSETAAKTKRPEPID